MTASSGFRRLAIGFGCSSRAEGEEIVRLIRGSVERIPADTLVATVDRRGAMGKVVSSMLGLELVLFAPETLAAVAGVTRESAVAMARMQTPSVAEAAALASLGVEARLVMARMQGRFCTCAVAGLGFAAGAEVEA